MAEIQVIRWSELRDPTPALLLLYMGSLGGYQIKHWVGRPGMVYPWRRILMDQSHWVISGELEIAYQNGFSYTLKAGDRDIIPAETWYMRRVIGEAPADYLLGEKVIVEKPKRKRGRPKKYE